MDWSEHFDFFPAPYESIRFKGQRFPIEIVLESYLAGWTAERLAEFFSYALTADQIKTVIRYYDEERPSVSGYLARNQAVAEWHRRFWTSRTPKEAREQLIAWNAEYGDQAEREGTTVLDLVRRNVPDPVLEKVAS